MNFVERYGPWAIVAGASEGTGSAFARRLAAQGINCILLARRAAPLIELAQEIRRSSNVECIAVPADLAAPDALHRIVTAVGEREVGLPAKPSPCVSPNHCGANCGTTASTC